MRASPSFKDDRLLCPACGTPSLRIVGSVTYRAIPGDTRCFPHSKADIWLGDSAFALIDKLADLSPSPSGNGFGTLWACSGCTSKRQGAALIELSFANYGAPGVWRDVPLPIRRKIAEWLGIEFVPYDESPVAREAEAKADAAKRFMAELFV